MSQTEAITSTQNLYRVTFIENTHYERYYLASDEETAKQSAIRYTNGDDDNREKAFFSIALVKKEADFEDYLHSVPVGSR